MCHLEVERRIQLGIVELERERNARSLSVDEWLSLAEDEGGELVMSQGLGEDEIRVAMNAFLPNALRCVPDGWATDGTIDTRVTVGCDGVVDTVEVLDGGGFPPDMVRCVKETIGYTPFPAHDQPDGMVFDYPVRLSF